MMVPRSYRYLSPPSSPKQEPSEKMGNRSARASPSPARTRTKQVEKKENIMPGPPARTVSDPAPVQSKPVVIPPRTPLKSTSSTQSVRARGHNGGRRTKVPDNHRSDAIPPAVAALLAVTTIPPPPPSRRRKGSTMSRRISIDELMQEWRQEDAELGHSLSNSPLDFLLERSDECDRDDMGSAGSPEQEKDYLSSRSVSSESIPSTLPSLDIDARSMKSTWSDPSTPSALSRKSGSERKEKMVQSPPKEDCVLDHPLLHFNPDYCEDIANMDVPDIVTTPPNSSLRFKSFKSNLTASLQALKSAAKSFSNFTAPSIPPDDLLTRSLLSPRFTSEMRPKQLQGLPSPALRRYLNPQPTPISPTELSMQLHESLLLDEDPDKLAPMIQMQTYDKRSRSSRKRRGASDPYSEAGRATSPAPAVRQREPRENGDFLRVIVLEMNMRREGKLDAKALGRARIWLPPRKSSGNKDAECTGGVPARWVGTLVDEP